MTIARRPGAATLAMVIGATVMVGGCGGEVIVTDGREGDFEMPIGEGGGGSGEAGIGLCLPCSAGACSLCAQVPSATHRCEEGRPAPNCIQLGGVFDDGEAYYTCWSCD